MYIHITFIFWTIFTKKEGNTRRVFSELIGIITNHNFLAAHEHKIGRAESPLCTICDRGEEMDSHHILYKCEALETIRVNSFQEPIEPKILEEGPENRQKFKYEMKAKHFVHSIPNKY